MQFLDALFSSGPFMPHGYCYMWVPGLVWLHVISDSLIALAYLSIPFTLAYFVRRRTDLPFNWMFLCFGVFILACGAPPGMEVGTFCMPTTGWEGLFRPSPRLLPSPPRHCL